MDSTEEVYANVFTHSAGYGRAHNITRLVDGLESRGRSQAGSVVAPVWGNIEIQRGCSLQQVQHNRENPEPTS